MSTPYEIPLTAAPQQLLISLANVTYQLTVKWNDEASVWVLDIADSSGNGILNGIPLVTGTDLLGQFAYLGLGGSLVAQTDSDLTSPPTFTNLGDTGHLYFVTTP
jgi:predicted Zn-dependent protease with MMP-like domain